MILPSHSWRELPLLNFFLSLLPLEYSHNLGFYYIKVENDSNLGGKAPSKNEQAKGMSSDNRAIDRSLTKNT
jgi:hypothetical protein